MTPLGHVGIALLAAEAATKIFPGIDKTTIIIATTFGGVAVDFDLFYRFYQKRSKIFDKTIGQHRFFPSHTPLFTFLVSFPLMIINFYFGIFFFIGTLVHLLTDTLFFPEGINFIYPIGKKMTRFFYINTHPFWAPRKISGVKNWHNNYLRSPIFWIFEVLPTFFAFVVLFHI